jgi:hypothetical protein
LLIALGFFLKAQEAKAPIMQPVEIVGEETKATTTPTTTPQTEGDFDKIICTSDCPLIDPDFAP